MSPPDRPVARFDPWANIPTFYNLGWELTGGQVRRGLGGRLAVLWENASGQTQALTYAQLDALSSRFASALDQLGVRRGDRVFLRLPNRPEFYAAALGAARLGAVFVPSSTQFHESEVRYRLRDAGAVAAITTLRLLPVIERVRADCPDLRHVVVVEDEDGSAPPDTLSWQALVNNGQENFRPAPTRNDDLAFLAYTSGTTGDPKGVVHLQRYPIAYPGLVRHWHDYRPGDVVACPSELGWLLPLASTFLYALAQALTVVLFDTQGGTFRPERWFGLIEKYRISNFTAPPLVYRLFVLAADAARRHDLSSWRHAVSAGEPLPPDTFAVMRRRLGLTVYDGLGMSECMVYCYNRTGEPIRPGSCGWADPGAIIELLDDDLQPVPAGREGVLCVRRDSHPGMMKEYWNKPERTAEVFRGPWYYTGDVLSRDSDGTFWFKGRNDDVIKASGYRISPFEVESCLVSHPAVAEAAVVAAPDPDRGSMVKAFLVLRAGHTDSEDLRFALQDFTRRHLAGYKCPRQIEFVAALPKTASGKVQRRLLREREKLPPHPQPLSPEGRGG